MNLEMIKELVDTDDDRRDEVEINYDLEILDYDYGYNNEHRKEID